MSRLSSLSSRRSKRLLFHLPPRSISCLDSRIRMFCERNLDSPDEDCESLVSRVGTTYLCDGLGRFLYHPEVFTYTQERRVLLRNIRDLLRCLSGIKGGLRGETLETIMRSLKETVLSQLMVDSLIVLVDPSPFHSESEVYRLDWASVSSKCAPFHVGSYEAKMMTPLVMRISKTAAAKRYGCDLWHAVCEYPQYEMSRVLASCQTVLAEDLTSVIGVHSVIGARTRSGFESCHVNLMQFLDAAAGEEYSSEGNHTPTPRRRLSHAFQVASRHM